MREEYSPIEEASRREARRVLAVGIPSMVLIPLGIYFGFQVLSGDISYSRANAPETTATMDGKGKRASLTP